MKLYSYWRSSTAYRVRIGLNVKNVSYQTIPVDLSAGGQLAPSYRQINPSQAVPALDTGAGPILTQSMAILEWLNDTVETPQFLPDDPAVRAQVRAAAMVIACDIHPLNNLRVLKHLRQMGHSTGQTTQWMQDWMTKGFAAFQALIPPQGQFAFGADVSLADICLVPQLYNARRWGLDLSAFPRLTTIEQTCLALPAFAQAHPDTQPDAPPPNRKPSS